MLGLPDDFPRLEPLSWEEAGVRAYVREDLLVGLAETANAPGVHCLLTGQGQGATTLSHLLLARLLAGRNRRLLPILLSATADSTADLAAIVRRTFVTTIGERRWDDVLSPREYYDLREMLGSSHDSGDQDARTAESGAGIPARVRAETLSGPLPAFLAWIRRLGLSTVLLADLSGLEDEDDALRAIGRLKDLAAPLHEAQGFDTEILFLAPTTYDLLDYVWPRGYQTSAFAPYTPEEVLSILWQHHRRLDLEEPDHNPLRAIVPASLVRAGWRADLSIEAVVVALRDRLLRLFDCDWRDVFARLAGEEARDANHES